MQGKVTRRTKSDDSTGAALQKASYNSEGELNHNSAKRTKGKGELRLINPEKAKANSRVN